MVRLKKAETPDVHRCVGNGLFTLDTLQRCNVALQRIYDCSHGESCCQQRSTKTFQESAILHHEHYQILCSASLQRYNEALQCCICEQQQIHCSCNVGYYQRVAYMNSSRYVAALQCSATLQRCNVSNVNSPLELHQISSLFSLVCFIISLTQTNVRVVGYMQAYTKLQNCN